MKAAAWDRHTGKDMKVRRQKSKEVNGLPIQGSRVNQSEKEVLKWIEETGIIK